MHINLWIIFGLSCAGKRGIKSYVYNAAVKIERFFQYKHNLSVRRSGTLWFFARVEQSLYKQLILLTFCQQKLSPARSMKSGGSLWKWSGVKIPCNTSNTTTNIRGGETNAVEKQMWQRGPMINASSKILQKSYLLGVAFQSDKRFLLRLYSLW